MTNILKKLTDLIEPDFVFSNNSINRFRVIENNIDKIKKDKTELLSKLKEKLNSIDDCKLKANSKNLVMGDGNINSSIMLIGEAPGELEDTSGHSYLGDVGSLLKKMLSAIDLKIKNVYTSYSINFRPPEDRKPTTEEIKRYSTFLKEHISIINPKIIILMGSSAMEAIFGFNSKISNERGKWKEIILKNKTYPVMTTFNPSYLIRFPENKKFSWEDLKQIRQKIEDLNIKI